MSRRVPASKEKALREAVFRAVSAFHAFKFAPTPFEPGVTPIPISGKVFDETELQLLADSAMDFWLTAGRYAGRFEARLGRRLGGLRVDLVNSGSSANLLAVSALTAPDLGERRLRPGDEVVTLACGFPTTVNPIVQNGLIPVFVDIRIPAYNASVSAVEAALSGKTKAIILPHTLGNPFAADAVAALARRKGLWLIEDACDALGSLYRGRPAGTFGDLATFSFYPAHHITMGEGGAVASTSRVFGRVLASLRDWGRDCWCAPGEDGTCGRRFRRKLGDLPYGYDHKYTYSRMGYNLKATEMQAAVGVAQLGKLDGFVRARRRNFALLEKALRRHEEFLELPQAEPGSEPAWFGFPLTVREGAPFTREKLTAFLESRRIGTRLLFAGNIVRQPYFKGVAHRRADSLKESDRAMRSTFWIGLYPGISARMIAYVAEQFDAFFRAL